MSIMTSAPNMFKITAIFNNTIQMGANRAECSQLTSIDSDQNNRLSAKFYDFETIGIQFI